MTVSLVFSEDYKKDLSRLAWMTEREALVFPAYQPSIGGLGVFLIINHARTIGNYEHPAPHKFEKCMFDWKWLKTREFMVCRLKR